MASSPNLPRHIAIIMDGNGRWAANRGLPRVAGHKQGAESVRRIVKAAAVLDGGDFFNDKNPDHNSHDLVRRTAKVHRSYPCPVYANVGNHDVRYGSLAHLDESPLSVCFESGIFRPCYGPHEVLLTDTDGTTVRIVGRPYQGARFDPLSLRVDPGQEDHLVVMLHQLASADPSLTFFPGEDVLPYSLFPDRKSVV